MEGNIVNPGDKLSTEEEYTPSRNTYVEEGVIYSAATGTVVMKDGTVLVEPLKEIRKFERGMYVLGKVSDTMKSVIFVTIDRVSSKNREYLALKDGKIIMRPQRGSERPMRGGGRFERGPRPQPEEADKPCRTGDTIIAKVIAEENDTYVLGLGSPEAGVVHANCSICGRPLQSGDRPDILVCNSCRRTERRKLSVFYNKPEEVKKYLDNIG